MHNDAGLAAVAVSQGDKGASLKIERVAARLISVPYDKPVKHPFLGARTRSALLIVQVYTSDGPVGLGFVKLESIRLLAAAEQIIRDLEPHIVGMDPLRREQIYRRMWDLTVDLLHEGASNHVLAAIDIALWDIFGKVANIPLWKLLGGYRDKVPAYAASSLWRHMDADEVASAGEKLVGEGFGAMKLRLGGRPLKEDVARVQALRAAVGPDVLIMTDALWGFTPAEAIRLAQEIAPYEITWLEEPVREGDFAGLERIRSHTTIPIAAGERISRLSDIPKLLPAVDHAIIDVHHIGGITPWLRAMAPLVEGNIPVSGHSSHEISAHLVAAMPLGGWVEFMPRRNVLYENPLQVVEGMIHLSAAPGLGLDLDEQALKRFSAAD